MSRRLEGRKRWYAEIDEDIWEKAKVATLVLGESMSSMTEKALVEYVHNHDTKEERKRFLQKLIGIDRDA